MLVAMGVGAAVEVDLEYLLQIVRAGTGHASASGNR